MLNRKWSSTTVNLLILTAGLCAGGVLAAMPGGTPQGIGTDRTRYVYPEGARQLGVTLTQYAKANYLVQAWVRGINPVTGDVENVSTPFFLKQPLVKTMPGGRYGFQVIQTKPVMVHDRESVYLLSFKLIPAEEKAATYAARANVVMTYNVKLFYRPEKLKGGGVADAAKKLTFTRQGGVLNVINPTPFWMTFYSLRIGSESLPDDSLRQMVPPFGQANYP
ncbi:molecular chaperone, partial [Trabulsiella odontotermitis]